MPSYAPSVRSSRSKFTPTQDYESRVTKTAMNEAQRLADMMGSAALIVEKKMGYVEPITPYPAHTLGQSIDYILEMATTALCQTVSQTNTDACLVVDEIRQEIAHYGENAGQSREQEEREAIKKTRAQRAEASREAFKQKVVTAFKKEEIKVKELTDKLVEKVAASEARRKEFDHQVVESFDKFGKKVVTAIKDLKEKSKATEVEIKEVDHKVVESFDKFGKKIVDTAEDLKEQIKTVDADRKEVDHLVVESMDNFGKQVVETFKKVDAVLHDKTVKPKKTPAAETSTNNKKKVDFSHQEGENKDTSAADDSAHEKKVTSSKKGKSKSKDIQSVDESIPEQKLESPPPHDKKGKGKAKEIQSVDESIREKKLESPPHDKKAKAKDIQSVDDSAHEKKLDIPQHDKKDKAKDIPSVDDSAHEKKLDIPQHDKKDKAKETLPTDESAHEEKVHQSHDKKTKHKSKDTPPLNDSAPMEAFVAESSTVAALEEPTHSEESEDVNKKEATSTRQSFGSKLAYLFGLDKKTEKKPVEAEASSTLDVVEEPAAETAPASVPVAEAENNTSYASPTKDQKDACDSAKASNSEIEEADCVDCPPNSNNCCGTPTEAGSIHECNGASSCNTCYETTPTVECCGESSTAAKDEEPCLICPDEIADSKTTAWKDAEVEAPSDDASCLECPADESGDKPECCTESVEPIEPVESEPVIETSSAPTTEATSTEMFHQLKGTKGETVSSMVFDDSRVQSLNPPKQFTILADGDKSCLVFEGDSISNAALGYIKLSWNRVSKGPVFIIGQPHFDKTVRQSSRSPRGQFSTYIPDKSKKAEPFFTFSFPQRSDTKRFPGHEYTWRAAPHLGLESDAQEIELREGDKKNEGELVAAWKFDPQTGDHILQYKQPFEHVDEPMMDKWLAALLLTSYCVIRHGMGNKEVVSA